MRLAATANHPEAASRIAISCGLCLIPGSRLVPPPIIKPQNLETFLEVKVVADLLCRLPHCSETITTESSNCIEISPRSPSCDFLPRYAPPLFLFLFFYSLIRSCTKDSWRNDPLLIRVCSLIESRRFRKYESFVPEIENWWDVRILVTWFSQSLINFIFPSHCFCWEFHE